MSKHIAAWTSTSGPYPALVSVYRVEGGNVQVTVRSASPDGYSEGKTAFATMSEQDFMALASDAYERGGLLMDAPMAAIDKALATVAGVPCRFCFGPGNAEGACPDCGKPKQEAA